jgi:hypothetical protein
MPSIAKGCLRFTGLFEAEVLLELMVRYWEHPLAADRDFRNGLLEGAAEALRLCVSGQEIIAEVPPKDTSFIAAVWYVEWCALAAGDEDPQGLRQAWLERIRQTLPSCFCAMEDLP